MIDDKTPETPPKESVEELELMMTEKEGEEEEGNKDRVMLEKEVQEKSSRREYFPVIIK